MGLVKKWAFVILAVAMTAFPGAIYAPRVLANRNGTAYDADKKTVIYAEDLSQRSDEIVAIENTLGTDPQGDKASVKARLDDIEAIGGGNRINTKVQWKYQGDTLDPFEVSGLVAVKSHNEVWVYPANNAGWAYAKTVWGDYMSGTGALKRNPSFDFVAAATPLSTHTFLLGIYDGGAELLAGFKFTGTHLYASYFNTDETQTEFEITGVDFTTFHKYSLRVDYPNKLQFYVDDDLKWEPTALIQWDIYGQGPGFAGNRVSDAGNQRELVIQQFYYEADFRPSDDP